MTHCIDEVLASTKVSILDNFEDTKSVVNCDRSKLVVRMDELEKSGQVKIDVHRVGGIKKKVTVVFETIESTAVAGKDFIEKSGEIVFDRNETEKSVSIEVKKDIFPADDDRVYCKQFMFRLQYSALDSIGKRKMTQLFDN